jgi:hypothetical protein
MHTIFNSLIQHVLTWLHGITSEQWQKAVELARKAAVDLVNGGTGAEKRASVLADLQAEWPDLKGSAINVLIELASSFIKKD